jgi:KDO2-lipid IV(A) lauroyltransferase
MDLREFAQTPTFIKFTLWLARVLPERFAHGLIRTAVNQVIKRQPDVYHIVRHNFAHFPGINGDAEKLDQVTRDMFFNGGRFYYDHYRHLGQSITQVENVVDIPQEYLDHIWEATNRGQGVLLVGTHTGNFDLGAMAVAAKGFKIQLLSLAAPPEGFKLMNDFRTSVGYEVTPITPLVLRKAIKRLREGGVAATALDWPIPEEGTTVEVFGKPSYAPLGGARLALLSGARVMVVSFYLDPVEGYKIHNVPPVDVVDTGNREADVVETTKRLVRIFEELVVQHPEQWMMYHPFWPMEHREEGGE